MTIWLLALILMGSLAGVGYRQGAIRVGISLVGILFAALLAVPMGKLVVPALRAFGVANPVYLWALGPFVIFVILLIIFKVSALAIHTKVDVYYKYKAGDLRLALWERINARLGLCLGLVNGLVYLILISYVIHVFSYWTVQISSPDDNPRIVRILNQMGRDLHKTGMARVAGSIDRLKNSYYDSADVAGLVFRNPLLEARVTRYPGFISLGLQPKFQALGADAEFSNFRLQQKPIKELMAQPSMAAIVNDPDLLREIWKTAQPDLHDFSNFLWTAKSGKYDEPILGRWTFSLSGTALALRRDNPKIAVSELAKRRRLVADVFAKTTLIAAPNGQLALKNVPQIKPPQPGVPPSADMQSFEGKWTGAANQYELEIGSADKKTGRIENTRLSVPLQGFTIVFEKED